MILSFVADNLMNSSRYGAIGGYRSISCPRPSAGASGSLSPTEATDDEKSKRPNVVKSLFKRVYFNHRGQFMSNYFPQGQGYNRSVIRLSFPRRSITLVATVDTRHGMRPIKVANIISHRIMLDFHAPRTWSERSILSDHTVWHRRCNQ